jgi:putative hemolysin
MKGNVTFGVAALFGCIALSACTPAEPPQSGAAIGNPASEYCTKEKGGRVEIVTDESGAQKGMCHLPDGTVVEEWELYRKEHSQNS